VGKAFFRVSIYFFCIFSTHFCRHGGQAYQHQVGGQAKRLQRLAQVRRQRRRQVFQEIRARPVRHPGGVEAIREKLKAEGHKVIQKCKRFLVEDFEKKTIVPKLK
jgi:hypothetical protein